MAVADVAAGSPASQAGVMPHDLIVAFDGTAIGGVDDLLRHLTVDAIGKVVTLDAAVRVQCSQRENSRP